MQNVNVVGNQGPPTDGSTQGVRGKADIVPIKLENSDGWRNVHK